MSSCRLSAIAPQKFFHFPFAHLFLAESPFFIVILFYFFLFGFFSIVLLLSGLGNFSLSQDGSAF